MNPPTIQLYTILRNSQTLQLCIPEKSSKKTLQLLQKHILKKLSPVQSSKLIRSFSIQSYQIHYFSQDQFTFIIATKLIQRIERVQNYLRVVAQIFYQNYDQYKFHIVLAKIVNQINRIEAQSKLKGTTFEEEDTPLTQLTINSYKDKFHDFIQKKDQQSKRVYITMSILFIAIFVLLMIFICKKWC